MRRNKSKIGTTDQIKTDKALRDDDDGNDNSSSSLEVERSYKYEETSEK
eukprot:CAMPEP_0116037850 /NCGR_PEP_ID=MMETSP0321-20121206/22347_1 /TAXON_ID=163516 /ORGANISM="Leptocylindrus danicus var. danicus, Strain B650" /LENGTH=48 /DNA_ID= /DNA_START= /DNA_END= /DNA_ORIENTATION=